MTEAETVIYTRVAAYLRQISRDPRISEDQAEVAAREAEIFQSRLDNTSFQTVESLADTSADIG